MEAPIRKKDLIKELILSGKIVKSDLFNLRYSNSLSKRQEVSFVVPAKIVQKAVDRNKIRRRAKAVMMKYMGDLKDTFSGVFMAKPGIKSSNFKEIENSIESIMKQIKN